MLHPPGTILDEQRFHEGKNKKGVFQIESPAESRPAKIIALCWLHRNPHHSSNQSVVLTDYWLLYYLLLQGAYIPSSTESGSG